MSIVPAIPIKAKDNKVYCVGLVATTDKTEDGETVYRFAVDTSFVVNALNIGHVDGLGIAGAQAGGVLTIQGDPLAIPIPASRPASLIAPANQASVNASTLFAGSVFDALNSQSVVYQLTNLALANGLDWEVLGGFAPDLSDGVVVQAYATIAHGGVGTFSTGAAVWRYYGVFIKSTVPGAPATGQLRGLMKS